MRDRYQRELWNREVKGKYTPFPEMAEKLALNSMGRSPKMSDAWGIDETKGHCLVTSVKSTIAMCISEDGSYLASTHGDHTVKVFTLQSASFDIIREFKGHPRTPWVVKFHPKDSNILSSGCIGSEVRVWCIQLKGQSYPSWQ